MNDVRRNHIQSRAINGLPGAVYQGAAECRQPDSTFHAHHRPFKFWSWHQVGRPQRMQAVALAEAALARSSRISDNYVIPEEFWERPAVVVLLHRPSLNQPLGTA